MVTEVEMTVWIQSVWSCETVKDQIVDACTEDLCNVKTTTVRSTADDDFMTVVF